MKPRGVASIDIITFDSSKESQGTQVNFNIKVAAAKRKCSTFLDKKVQCSYCDNRSEHNTLKDCQSPMVIISVYPKSSPENFLKATHVSAVSSRSNHTAPPLPSAGVATNTSNVVIKKEQASNKSDSRTLNYKSPRMSRSPSPVKKASKPKLLNNSLNPPVTEKKSPDNQRALRAIKAKIREKDRLKEDSSVQQQLPIKNNTSSATRVSKNFKNLTISNANQVTTQSKRNVGLYTASHSTQMSNKNNNISNGTQVSVKRIKNSTTNATQYNNEEGSFTISNAMQCKDTADNLEDIAPIKHPMNEVVASPKYPQRKPRPIKNLRTQVSQATQVPKIHKYYSNHATQVTKRDPLMISCATQVSKNQRNVIIPRMAKNQEAFIVKPAQGYKSDQPSRLVPKTKAEIGTNTDHARAKKALVDTFTKKLTQQMTQKCHTPGRFDSSKVTINIDGDTEYYDVLFNQDEMSTDLMIRKTLKDKGCQKFGDESSLVNLFRVSDTALEEGQRCPSNVPYNVSVHKVEDENRKDQYSLESAGIKPVYVL